MQRCKERNPPKNNEKSIKLQRGMKGANSKAYYI